MINSSTHQFNDHWSINSMINQFNDQWSINLMINDVRFPGPTSGPSWRRRSSSATASCAGVLRSLTSCPREDILLFSSRTIWKCRGSHLIFYTPVFLTVHITGECIITRSLFNMWRMKAQGIISFSALKLSNCWQKFYPQMNIKGSPFWPPDPCTGPMCTVE